MTCSTAPQTRRHLAIAAALATATIFLGTLVPVTAPPAAATNYIAGQIDLRTPTHLDPSPVDIVVDEAAGRAFVANATAGTISVIDSGSQSVIDTVALRADGSNPGPAGLALDTVHHRLYVANYSASSVSIVDTTTNSVVRELQRGPSPSIGGGPSSIAIDMDAGRVFVLNSADLTVSVLDTQSSAVVAVMPDIHTGFLDFPLVLASEPSTGRTYVVKADGSVSSVDTTTLALSVVIPPSRIMEGSRKFAVSPGRMYLATPSAVTIIDTTSNTVLGRIDAGLGPQISAIAVDQEGSRLWVMTYSQNLVYDVTTNVLLKRIDAEDGPSADFGATALGVDGEHAQMFAVVKEAQEVAVVDLESVRGLVRQSGADRFASAVRVSAAEFAPGVEAVYVASGENFPDALSGSAAAGSQGVPVLLVGRNSVPPGVGDEIRRLKPKRIVVLGGPQAVSTEVETELGGYAPIARLTGADRFAVSAAVSRTNFPVGVPVAYVASGENFPDALSGGAAAAHGDAPVLLVSRNGVPVPVETELKRLKPGKIVVLGGENAVSSDVASALRDIAPTERITGADRFVVSAAISAATFPGGAKTVFVASGAGFADALAGGPAAAANGGPVLLVRPDAVPDAIGAELQRLKPTRIVVLGGEQAVSKAVFEQLRAFVK